MQTDISTITVHKSAAVGQSTMAAFAPVKRQVITVKPHLWNGAQEAVKHLTNQRCICCGALWNEVEHD